MKKYILFSFALFSINCISQDKTAPDFTVKDTDGNTLNLYSELAKGRIIMLDFFYTTCSYCIQYSPIIEKVYTNHGAGKNEFEIWGIDLNDDDAAVKAYKQSKKITNPCASGQEGGANAVIKDYTGKFPFNGYPTYAIVCPNKQMFWDKLYPPTVTGFDSDIATCKNMLGVSNDEIIQSEINKIYPNPSAITAFISFAVNAPAEIKFELFNILGESVYASQLQDFGKGNHVYQIPLEKIAAGSYFVTYWVNGRQQDIKKLNVVR